MSDIIALFELFKKRKFLAVVVITIAIVTFLLGIFIGAGMDLFVKVISDQKIKMKEDEEARFVLKKMFSQNIQAHMDTLDYINKLPWKELIKQSETSKTTITFEPFNTSAYDDTFQIYRLFPPETSDNISAFYGNLEKMNETQSFLHKEEWSFENNNRWLKVIRDKSKANCAFGKKIIDYCGGKGIFVPTVASPTSNLDVDVPMNLIDLSEQDINIPLKP